MHMFSICAKFQKQRSDGALFFFARPGFLLYSEFLEVLETDAFMEKSSPLLGTWSLLSWYNETKDGRRIYPIGKNISGYISYAPDGFVFVHIMAADRQNYAVNDPLGGTLAEDSAAMKSQITYAGRYEDHGDHVVHQVTTASCPNWVGTKQVRQVRLSGNDLQLSAAGIILQQEEVTAYLDWKRATA